MSLDNKKFKYFKKDEKAATVEYTEAAEMAISGAAKKMFRSMAEDEARHAMMLDVIKSHEKDAGKEKKSRFGRFRGKAYEDEVKEHFEKEGVYQEQGAEEDVSENRPELPEKNEWNEEYEEDDD
jgi:rubrerythrin